MSFVYRPALKDDTLHTSLQKNEEEVKDEAEFFLFKDEVASSHLSKDEKKN